MSSKSWDTLMVIRDNILENFELEVPSSYLRQIIMKEKGLDERTIVTTLKRLVELKIIEHTENRGVYRVCRKETTPKKTNRKLTKQERNILEGKRP